MLVPYSNSHEVTGSPSGSTVPLTVADVSAGFDAAPVLASGTTNAVNTSISWLAAFETYTAPVLEFTAIPSLACISPDPNRSISGPDGVYAATLDS